MNQFPEKIPEKTEFKKRTSLSAKLNEPMTQEEVKKEAEEITQLVKFANKKPGGFPIYEVDHVENDGYGEGIPVLNRKTSAPVLPYGSPRSGSEEKEPPPVRRKSSELSTSMKSRLELFMKQEDEQKNQTQRVVEPDNTFREKLQ